MTKRLKWVLEKPENEYYWASPELGWIKKNIPDEVWRIVEIGEDQE